MSKFKFKPFYYLIYVGSGKKEQHFLQPAIQISTIPLCYSTDQLICTSLYGIWLDEMCDALLSETCQQHLFTLYRNQNRLDFVQHKKSGSMQFLQVCSMYQSAYICYVSYVWLTLQFRTWSLLMMFDLINRWCLITTNSVHYCYCYSSNKKTVNQYYTNILNKNIVL